LKDKPGYGIIAETNSAAAFKRPGDNDNLSAEDLAIKKQLIGEIAPLDETVFHLRDGSKVTGIAQTAVADYINVRQVFGNSGNIVRRLARKDILWAEAAGSENAEITLVEIKVRKEFKNFKFYRKGIYSFFTDQDYFKIAKTIGLLGNLYSEFNAIFNPLIDQRLSRHACVIVFGKPDEYRSYAARVAPYLAGSSGFYNPRSNLFAMYNFFEEAYYKQAGDYVMRENERIRKMKEDNKKYADIDYETYQHNLRQIESYEASLSGYMNNITFSAKGSNIEVLRHESAHQLSFELGVLAGNNFDTWLIEGLATFCQTSSIGVLSRENLSIFKTAITANKYIALKDLFSYTDNAKFYNLGRDEENLAYKESWALFYYLMQPQFRPQFFKYMVALNNENRRILSVDERIGVLEDKLGVSLGELEKKLTGFVSNLH
jgi:hypothetical protein